LKIARQAQSLREQEIQAQRDSINKKLEAIKADLLREQRGVYRLQQETREQDSLRTEQTHDLRELHKDNRTSQEGLKDVAREASETPALQQIGEKAQDIADKELDRSGDDLQKARDQKKADARTERFKDADKELTSAVKKLEDLQKANDRLAQERL